MFKWLFKNSSKDMVVIKESPEERECREKEEVRCLLRKRDGEALAVAQLEADEFLKTEKLKPKSKARIRTDFGEFDTEPFEPTAHVSVNEYPHSYYRTSLYSLKQYLELPACVEKYLITSKEHAENFAQGNGQAINQVLYTGYYHEPSGTMIPAKEIKLIQVVEDNALDNA